MFMVTGSVVYNHSTGRLNSQILFYMNNQKFTVCDDHTGTLGLSFFTYDDLNRRIPVLYDTAQSAHDDIASHLAGCKHAVEAGYLEDYEDSGYVVAQVVVNGDVIEVSIDDYPVYSGSLYEVEA
jgi:hypothetical protein